VAVKVFEGNTGDPLREGFGLSEVVVIGDRGMITSARIRQDLPASSGIQWITALRASQVQKLATTSRSRIQTLPANA
jgi:hypothetical protein